MFVRYLPICYLVFTIAIIGLISACNPNHKAKEIKDDPKKLAEAKKLLNKLNHKYGIWNNRQAINNWNDTSDLDRISTSLSEDDISKMSKPPNSGHLNSLEKQSILRILYQNSDYLKKKDYFGSDRYWESVDDVDDSTFVEKALQEINKFPWRSIRDYDVRRQFKKFSDEFRLILSHQQYPEYSELIAEMEKIYSTTKMCNVTVKDRCELVDAQEMWDYMRKTTNLNELEYIWKSWHDTIGEKVKNNFIKYVKYSNKIAKINNFEDMSAMWLNNYETDDFLKEIDSLWLKIQPLYNQLHAYIRRKLRKIYGKELISKKGPIPAHLFGHIQAQSWAEIGHLTSPYPNKKFPKITNLMIQQNWDEKKIFRVAESFFTSIKLNPMPKLFWQNSILKKPKNQKMVCHAAAYDFFDGKDFRIKQCTKIDMDNLLTAYHEMGHVEYYIQYKNQPIIYRDGANAGFHEAVGDTISLSAFTLNNFKRIGLLKHSAEYDYETMINHLYSIALEKVAFIPFAYLMDKWRYDVFQSRIEPENYNCHWWYLSEKYRGIIPPVKRTQASFDPAAKYHIVADVEYMRYFISHILQFQFHKSLCVEAGEYDPIYPEKKPMSNCNIHGSKKAGKLLK
ncbi:hypothetical protein PV328_003961 [Microctonus aethiopoides]|uniref:Angiotensin-converting enzyme n=1 Tax=Microctonus aethiopoides TaxID=144406 RepID=A0AA39F9J2_9HYME|nr:hypothetical protein PV328_003961 [Microctonus aethiopoides]